MENTVIIIPAYNEEQNIGRTLREIVAQHLAYDIVVVNDGSGDLTAQEVKKAGVEILNLPFNSGYGVAVETGFKYAIRKGYSRVVLLDADGQHDPKFIPAMIDKMNTERANVVIGSRFSGKAEYKISVARKFGIAFFSKIVQWITHQHILDITSGFQVIDQKVLRFLTNGNYPVDYPDSDVILDLILAGFKIVEVPVVIRGRTSGVSMHASKLKNFYYIYKMFLALFMVVLRHKTIKRGNVHGH